MPERYNPVLVEIAETFVHFVKLHFKLEYLSLVNSYRHTLGKMLPLQFKQRHNYLILEDVASITGIRLVPQNQTVDLVILSRLAEME